MASEPLRKDGSCPITVSCSASLGQWNGAAAQWVDELTTAVLEHHAAGFIYRSPDDTPADEALARWATEIVPAVREAITR